MDLLLFWHVTVVNLRVIGNRGVHALVVHRLHMSIRCHVLLRGGLLLERGLLPGRELRPGRGFLLLDRLRVLLVVWVLLLRLYASCERKGTAYQYCNAFHHSRS